MPHRSPPSDENEYIDELIKDYRDGDSRAGENLLTKFQPYLLKWRHLLIRNCWDGKDTEVRHFLYLLGGNSIHTTLQVMDIRLQAYEREDLNQECAVAFLDCAWRYGNIVRYYRYLLKERIKNLIYDPLVTSYPYNQPVSDDIKDTTLPDIDEDWVSGLTCSNKFYNLRKRDREILHLVKWYGYTIKETAGILGISAATVNRSLRSVKDQLQEEGEND